MDPNAPTAPASAPAPPADPATATQTMTTHDIMAAFSAMIPAFTTAMIGALSQHGQQAAPAAPAPMPAAPPEQAPAPEDLDADGMPDDLEPDADGDGIHDHLDDDAEDPEPANPEQNCTSCGCGKAKEKNSMSAPSGTNTAVPAPARRNDRNARDGGPDRYARLEAENAALRERVEVLEQVDRYARRHAQLKDLAGEFVLDADAELEETQDFDDAAFADHVGKRIPARYQRVVEAEEPAAPLVEVDRNSRSGQPDRGGISPRQGAMVAKYAAKWGTLRDETLARLKADHADEWAANA